MNKSSQSVEAQIADLSLARERENANADSPAKSRRVRSRSSGSEQSIARILDATQEAISRQGPSSLSMSDVCRIAGVARGTLYRYFPSKDALLESFGQRTRQQTEQGIRAAAASANNGRDALAAVILFLKLFAEEKKSKAMLEVEPHFFLDFLHRQERFYVEVITEALGIFYDEIDSALEHKVNRELCSEIIFRLQTSYIFLPDTGSSELLSEAILQALAKIIANGQSVNSDI